MGSVIGDLLPLALGVAVSPVPIIAVILMLLATQAGAASTGFGLGWVLGIVVVTVVALVMANVAGVGGTSAEPSTATSWIKLALGLMLLGVGLLQWRRRPQGDEQAPLPKWMVAIDDFTPGKAFGLGFLLSAVNPKNLLMCAAAGVTIAGGGLDTGQQTVAVVIFTLIGSSTVVVPVVGYALAREPMRRPLDELKTWLQANNATVMAVLILVIGVALFGSGLGGLL
jgi:threonine/homoserine/homoserine lactone efflux protein